jgi:hypothetical protein
LALALNGENLLAITPEGPAGLEGMSLIAEAVLDIESYGSRSAWHQRRCLDL